MTLSASDSASYFWEEHGEIFARVLLDFPRNPNGYHHLVGWNFGLMCSEKVEKTLGYPKCSKKSLR